MSNLRRHECPFCWLPPERVIESNGVALAIADAFPVSPDHSLIIPVRHVVTFFELSDEEVAAVHGLLRRAKARLDSSLCPGGYNIGINAGKVAGQSIPHVHVHLIPRYVGDVADPIGGVRNVIPGCGRYPRNDS
jgi:diadenosine tetraphosphate (Ap4A) HIT family hydrolase